MQLEQIKYVVNLIVYSDSVKIEFSGIYYIKPSQTCHANLMPTSKLYSKKIRLCQFWSFGFFLHMLKNLVSKCGVVYVGKDLIRSDFRLGQRLMVYVVKKIVIKRRLLPLLPCFKWLKEYRWGSSRDLFIISSKNFG